MMMMIMMNTNSHLSNDAQMMRSKSSPMQNVNITGFRLVDPTSQVARHYLKKFPSRYSPFLPSFRSSFIFLLLRLKGRDHPLYSSNALIYDAVQVLAKALNDLASMEVTFTP